MKIYFRALDRQDSHCNAVLELLSESNTAYFNFIKFSSPGAWRMWWPPGGRSWCHTGSASVGCDGKRSSCPGLETLGWLRREGYLVQSTVSNMTILDIGN